MIEKIRPVADDVNVAVRKVYGKANDAYAYYDSACKNKVTCAELQDAYIKGLMIDVAGILYKPVSCAVAGNVATVTYVTTDSATATTAKLATVKSDK